MTSRGRSGIRAVIAVAVAGLLPAGLARVPTAFARSCRQMKVPHGAKFGCLTCHNSTLGGTRNAFGLAVQPRVGFGTCEDFWLTPVTPPGTPHLATLDSDGDGMTNGEELQDPTGAWRPGMPNPGDRALVTNPGVRNPRFIRADADASGAVNITDAVITLEYLFRKRPVPACRSAADANNDGRLDVTDPLLILFHLFSAREVSPPHLFPGCGVDLVADTLDCRVLPACP